MRVRFSVVAAAESILFATEFPFCWLTRPKCRSEAGWRQLHLGPSWQAQFVDCHLLLLTKPQILSTNYSVRAGPMQGTSKAEQVFQPGDAVPESGVYMVVHDQHRHRHSATIFKGGRFPQCARCGKAVRFVLARPAVLISEDTDFRQSSTRSKGQSGSDAK